MLLTHFLFDNFGLSLYVRLMEKIGRADLTGSDFKSNSDRVKKQAVIEAAIQEWTSSRSVNEVLEAMSKSEVRSVACRSILNTPSLYTEEARVPCGPINTVKDIVEDEHVKARGMIEEVPVHSPSLKKEWTVKM